MKRLKLEMVSQHTQVATIMLRFNYNVSGAQDCQRLPMEPTMKYMRLAQTLLRMTSSSGALQPDLQVYQTCVADLYFTWRAIGRITLATMAASLGFAR